MIRREQNMVQDTQSKAVPSDSVNGGIVGFYRKSMTVLAVVFFVAGLLFLLAPDAVVRTTNWASKISSSTMEAPVVSDLAIDGAWNNQYLKNNGDGSAMEQMIPGRLWAILSFTMMMMITVICAANAINPYRYVGWVPLLIFSKLCSSVTGLLVFKIGDGHYMSDLSAFATDFPLFVFILVLYLLARGTLNESAV
jgi:hypothetical protein